MKVHEIMTAHARCVGPENTLVEAAGLMRELDVGALPVCEEERLVGMVTDRDITLRGVAGGRDPNTTPIHDVMSLGIVYVFADQPVEEVARIMEERQIRRVPVLNRGKRLVGIVSLGDIAISSSPAFSGIALRDVSEPREPTTRQRRLAERSQPPKMPKVPEATRGPAAAKRSGGDTARRRTTSTKKSSRAKATGGSTRKKSAAGGAKHKPAQTTRSAGRAR